MCGKSITICENEFKDITSLRLVLRSKTHRKVLSGLRLLTETCKTARPSCNVRVSKVHVRPKDGDEDGDFLEKQSELPLDVLMYQILARMPIKALLQTKSVSKEWYSTVSSNEFAKVHFKTRLCYHPSSPIECLFIQAANSCYLFYLQEEERVLDYSLVKLEPNFDNNPQNELHLVGSCNGLVCLSDYVTGYFYIWNPVAYNWQKFSDFCKFSNNSRTSWGFAYVSSIDDYKVVRIAESYDTQTIIVHVFSLKTKEWRQIHSHGLDLHLSLAKTNPGVLVNDTLYWIMATKDATKKQFVVGFSLLLENFEVVPDIFPRSASFRDNFLCVMGGCLSLYTSNMHKEAYMSIMKQPGLVDSITVSPHSDPWSCSGLVGFTRTGKSLVISKNWELALVDLNSSPRQYFLLVTFAEAGKPCVVNYSPSLISPSAV